MRKLCMGETRQLSNRFGQVIRRVREDPSFVWEESKS
jgi:hypothetical protein